MSAQISAPVGRWERGAQNIKSDVQTVQQLLQSAAGILHAPELDPHGADGEIAHPPAPSATVAAIEAFQRRLTSNVDGVIQPDSDTWHALVHVTGASDMPAQQPNDPPCCFPFPVVPNYSWEDRPRAFASPRAGGSRLHAGCDLYFPRGTPMHAVADGTVVRGPYPFYCETFALEIDHGPFLARYGEIQSNTEVLAGDRVKPTLARSLADAKRIQGEYEPAREAYEQALKLGPTSADAELGLGLTYALQNKLEPALAALRKASALDPRDPDIQYELGRRLQGAEAVAELARGTAGLSSAEVVDPFNDGIKEIYDAWRRPVPATYGSLG
jgi:tetratricopeptide (TPR) repeat protein